MQLACAASTGSADAPPAPTQQVFFEAALVRFDRAELASVNRSSLERVLSEGGASC